MQLTKQVKVDNVKNASIDALRIIKKTAQDLRNGINKEALIHLVEQFLSEDGKTPAHRCLVGHNVIHFDRKFLWQLWETFDKTFPFELYLDTMHMTRGYAKQRGIIKPKLKLQDACDMLGAKKTAGAHNASDDTRSCYFLWEQLMKNVNHLEYIQRLPHREDNSISEELNDQ